MSLITLSSSDNVKPYLYSSHFPQPIRISAGSQVCCLKFIHFRDENEYLVNSMTDTLYFILGNKQNDGKRKVVLTHGSYTPTELATEIARAMNASLQQQNYLWACSYASVGDVFTISYSSQTTPSATGGSWTDYIGDNSVFEVRNNDTVGGHSLILPKNVGPVQIASAFLTKGILTHLGTYESEAITLNYDNDTFTASNAVPFEWMPSVIGIVRDVLSVPFPQNPNANSAFDQDTQDIRIVLEGQEIQISSLDQTANTAPTNPNYVSNRLMRLIPTSAVQTLGQLDVSNKTQMYNAMFKFVITFVSGATNRAICQMFVSTNRGSTYTAATTTTNDASGNPYFRTFVRADGVSMDGVFWVSDSANFNDNGRQKTNIFVTKRCPYVPTLTAEGTQTTYSYPELVRNITLPTWTGSSPADTYTLSAYTGSNSQFVFTATGSSNTYYLSQPSAAAGGNLLEFGLSDVDSAATPTGDATVHADSGGMTINYPSGGTDNWNFNGDPAELYMNSTTPQYEVSGIFNPDDRPVSTELHEKDFNVKDDDLVSDATASLVGADVSKKYWLFMKKLTQDDVAKGTTQTPIKLGEPSGNIGTLVGASDNLYTGATSTGTDVFVSNGSPNKIGKSTTLHISIPELPVKSYEGGYDSIGKNIAVLPREEFKSQGSDSGQLVYVADFENWVDIQSATDLYVNQFSVEIRNPDGSLATDLLPDTTLQIKIREDPLKKQAEQMNRLLMTMSTQRTGQILSQDISQTYS
jgi:hypothetical protein